MLGCSGEDRAAPSSSAGTQSASATSGATTSGGGTSGGNSSAGSGGGQSGGAGGAGGSGGSGGAAGKPSDGDASVDAGGEGDSGDGGVDSDGGAPMTDGGSGSETDADGGSRCSPTCGATAPICDETSATCKPIEVLALYTEYEQNPDLAHRSWVREANAWFPTAAQANGFVYRPMTGWDALKTVTPAAGRVVLFLDNKPLAADQQASFKAYMDNGGAWMGFHFAAYNPSPSDWDWYFNQFLGSGGYNGNTWRPTSAHLKVEDAAHPVAKGLGSSFTAAPNEWYAWKVDLRTKSNIKILCSIDPSSFPLGTGPKPNEIWHSGYYPVVWTNTNYKMLYVNMGHNDMDYEGGTNRQLSFAFRNALQNQMLVSAIRWLGGAPKGP